MALDITERRRAERRLATQYAVSRVLAEAIDFDEVMPKILQTIGEGLGWAYGALWTADNPEDVLRYAANWCAPGQAFPELEATNRRGTFVRSVGLPGRAWAIGEPVWIADATTEVDFPRLAIAAAEGLRGGFGVPILVGGDVVGVLEFFDREVHDQDPELLEMAATLSGQIGQFIERIRAEAMLRVHAQQQAAVADLGRHALTQVDLDALLAEAVAVVAATLDVAYCKVLELLPGGEALRLRAGIGWQEGLVGHATVGAGIDSQAGYTLLSDEPVIVTDLRTETRFRGPPLLHEHGVVSGMSVVIRGREGPYGVLGAHTRQRRDFTHDDAQFLRAVANVLAAALRRKDLEEQVTREHAEAARLEAQERARDEFLAAISHDLKTPLTAAQFGIGMVEMSATERLLPQEQDLLGNSLRSVERLGVLIDNLLTANLLKVGALELDHEPLDLREVVAHALPSIQPLIQRKEQTLVIDLPESMPVAGDAKRLERVVVNLLANANRHTPASTRITITGGVMGGEARLSVADTGPGIPSEELKAIFRRFYRPHSTPAGGSGLGLAIAETLVTLHGGRIWAESTPGQGATFHVALPVPEAVIPDQPPRVP